MIWGSTAVILVASRMRLLTKAEMISARATMARPMSEYMMRFLALEIFWGSPAEVM